MNWTKTKNILPPNDEFVIFWNPEYKFCPFRVAKSNIIVDNGKSYFYELNKYSTYYNNFSIDPIYWRKNDISPLNMSFPNIINNKYILITNVLGFLIIGKCLINEYGVQKYILIEKEEEDAGLIEIQGWSFLPEEPINNKKIVKRYEILDI